VLPALAAGAGLAFSIPPWGWWPLAYLGAAVLFLRLRGLSAGQRLLTGWVAGLACFVPGLLWAAAFNWYGAAALMVVEAASMGVAALLVPSRHWRLPAFVGAFTLLEALRMSWPFGGLPLGGVFLGQASGPWLPIARLGGPLLLTAVVWLGGATLGVLAGSLGQWYRGEWLSAPIMTGLVVVAALWGALIPISRIAADGGAAIRSLAVSAVQGGGRHGTSSLEVSPSSVFMAQVQASAPLMNGESTETATHGDSPEARGGTAAHASRLVLWPEDVVSLARPLQGSKDAATISNLARRASATVVAGVTIITSATTFRNEAVAWSPSGQIVGTYEKVHRVPFGEYVPFRSFFAHLANLSAVPRDAIPGHGNGLMVTPAGKLGLMVSFEVFFANRSQSSVAAGAQLLVVPTNTSSYATSQVPAQELAADRVQAVETGRDLVQASPTGYSVIVDNRGAVLSKSALGRRQILAGVVHLRDGKTPYDRYGDLPMLALCGIALAGAWVKSAFSGRPRWWRSGWVD
jgi:apolipoprotein N-acyltransferase